LAREFKSRPRVYAVCSAVCVFAT